MAPGHIPSQGSGAGLAGLPGIQILLEEALARGNCTADASEFAANFLSDQITLFNVAAEGQYHEALFGLLLDRPDGFDRHHRTQIEAPSCKVRFHPGDFVNRSETPVLPEHRLQLPL